MVSVWMDHGNIMGFTAAHPDANRIKLVRVWLDLGDPWLTR